MRGSLNPNQSPKISVKLSGVLGKPQLFEAIIDTGFTGSVSMPLVIALPLGFVLFSTANFTLADGSTENTFLCLGTIEIEGVQKKIIISLSKGNDILLGTELLALFGTKFELDYLNNNFNFKPQTKPTPLPVNPPSPSN